MERTVILVQRQLQLVIFYIYFIFLLILVIDFLFSVCITACEEEWRRLAASAAAETRLLSPGMQQIPNQIRATQGTPLGEFSFCFIDYLDLIRRWCLAFV
jgi:hypothetical protein